jgi:hypothetical protein
MLAAMDQPYVAGNEIARKYGETVVYMSSAITWSAGNVIAAGLGSLRGRKGRDR